MEFYAFANRAIRYTENILIATIVSVYVLTAYVSIFRDGSILSSYLIIVSFLYYLHALAAAPGSLLDLGNASVKGLCNICNRVRGNRTRHCHVCNKCYNKIDHHCLLLGKCLAENNMRDFYFCILFLMLFLVSWLVQKDCKALLGILTLCVSCYLAWISVCISQDKATTEGASFKHIREPAHLRRLGCFLKGNPLKILLPLAYCRNDIEY